jgi:hypothetical protein
MNIKFIGEDSLVPEEGLPEVGEVANSSLQQPW